MIHLFLGLRANLNCRIFVIQLNQERFPGQGENVLDLIVVSLLSN